MVDAFPVDDAWGYLVRNSAAIRPQLYLILWSLGILCLDPLLRPRDRRPMAVSFSLAGLAFASLFLFTIWDEGAGPAFNATITLDSFACFFDLLFLIGAAAAVLISYRYLDIEHEQHSEYYALILLATSGMMFMAGALDLVTIFVGLELMSISTYILVGLLRHSRRSNEAALKYFLLGAFSTGIILYGMSLLYGITGTTRLSEIGETIASLPEDGGLAALAIFMMMAGLCFKIAAVPFHMWVPDAYEGAPTGITAYMSVAVKAAAFAIFFRIFLVAFPSERETYLLALALISMLTMTWGNFAAVTQSNVKRLLAYSSISHAGYVMMGLVAGGQYGIRAAAVYLLAYTFMNLGIWAVLIMLRRQDIQGEEMDDFNGLFHKHPGLAVLMLIFLLSLAGIPPLGGFIAKYFVFAAVIREALESSGGTANLMTWLAIVGALNAVVALFYYLRIVKAMFLEGEPVAAPLGVSLGIWVTLAVTGLLTVLMGVYPEPFIQLADVAGLPLM